MVDLGFDMPECRLYHPGTLIVLCYRYSVERYPRLRGDCRAELDDFAAHPDNEPEC